MTSCQHIHMPTSVGVRPLIRSGSEQIESAALSILHGSSSLFCEEFTQLRLTFSGRKVALAKWSNNVDEWCTVAVQCCFFKVRSTPYKYTVQYLLPAQATGLPRTTRSPLKRLYVLYINISDTQFALYCTSRQSTYHSFQHTSLFGT